MRKHDSDILVNAVNGCQSDKFGIGFNPKYKTDDSPIQALIIFNRDYYS